MSRPRTFTLFPYTTLFRSLLRAMCLRNIEGLTHSARHLHSLIGLSSRRRAELRYFFRVVRADRALLHLRAVGHDRSEEHTSELQSRLHLVCRLLLEKKNPH